MRCAWLAGLALSACGFQAGATSEPAIDATEPTTDTSTKCADDDNDGVCNDVDKCPGFDDHIDSDGDGVPDGCDDWPCGAKPTAPNQKVSQGPWTVENTMVGGEASTLAVIRQNTDLSISLKYTMFVTCVFDSQCDAEMKFGHDPGGVDGCFVQGTFFNFSQVSANTTKTLQFDLGGGTMPKAFDVKADSDGGHDCQHWAFGTPDSKSVIAKVCVTP